jgi:hypothetical protein
MSLFDRARETALSVCGPNGTQEQIPLSDGRLSPLKKDIGRHQMNRTWPAFRD